VVVDGWHVVVDVWDVVVAVFDGWDFVVDGWVVEEGGDEYEVVLAGSGEAGYFSGSPVRIVHYSPHSH